ncbi:MAG: type 1 glutamine amidotransferase [Rhodospirillaceae bacterium]|jgi:GMP synthase-like glutamine amidotransferase|nr:type 1 glutamine amidotransferase [Rhodospirillaceae bacterium]
MRISVLQHAGFEHAGILRDFMRDDGIVFDVTALDEGDALPKLDKYDALIVLGGPMAPLDYDSHPWLASETELVRQAVAERALPTLGICLGHQLIAQALGGSLSLLEKTEVGVVDITLNEAGKRDPLFAGLEATSPGLQWHDWQIGELPPGAIPLAHSDGCAIQAMRAAPRAWGVQFHIETCASTVSEWLEPPGHEQELQKHLGPDAHAIFEAQAAENMARLNRDARRLFNNFTALARLPAEAVEG